MNLTSLGGYLGPTLCNKNHRQSSGIPHPRPKEYQYYEWNMESVVLIRKWYADWIDYMEFWWDNTVLPLRWPREPNKVHIPDRPISVPAEIKFDETLDCTLLYASYFCVVPA